VTVLKGAQIEPVLRKIPAGLRAILVYGPDKGLVNERARRLAGNFVADSGDPFAKVRIRFDDIRADPGRIADEVTSVALFGGARAVWITPEGADITNTLSGLEDKIGEDVLVIVEGGDLKPTSGLRKLFEKSTAWAALPCYADTGRDLAAMVDEQLAAANIRIDQDARTLLLSSLGGDRQATRMELDKVCLYAGEGGTLTLEDVAGLVGDVSALDLDQLVDAVGLGDLTGLDTILRRLYAAGQQPVSIVSAAIRHFLALHAMGCEVRAGSGIRSVVEGARPPIFFRRRDRIARQLESWTLDRLEIALDRLHEAEHAARTGNALVETLVSHTLMHICAHAPTRRKTAA
jgi:DNA polymerase-3 subunit delta